MRIIKIEPEANGAHANQNLDSIIQVPEGWAIIPEAMEIPETFPFVQITVRDGIVISMLPDDVPPKDEIEDFPESSVSIDREISLLKLKIQAQSEREEFLEDCIAEMAMKVYESVW